MTDIHDLNKDSPAVGTNDPGPALDEAGKAHRRVERAADKAADRANERQRKDDPGEFSNIGPI